MSPFISLFMLVLLPRMLFFIFPKYESSGHIWRPRLNVWFFSKGHKRSPRLPPDLKVPTLPRPLQHFVFIFPLADFIILCHTISIWVFFFCSSSLRMRTGFLYCCPGVFAASRCEWMNGWCTENDWSLLIKFWETLSCLKQDSPTFTVCGN